MLRSGFTLIAIRAGLAVAQTTTSAPKPQPTFAMTIRLNESTVTVDAEVIAETDLTNTSGNDVQCFLPVAGPFLYAFKVFGPNGKSAPLTSLGQAVAWGGGYIKGKKGEMRIIPGVSVFLAVVAPGGTLHDQVVLSDYVDLSQPNEYTIHLERTDPYTKLVVNSNSTTLTVTKPE